MEIAGREVRTVRRIVQYTRRVPKLKIHHVWAVWRNAPRIWRDFGSALPFQTRLTQTKSVLPLSNEYGSQVKDQGQRRCCHNKHKIFPYRPTRDVSLLSGQASWIRPSVHVRTKIYTPNSVYSVYGRCSMQAVLLGLYRRHFNIFLHRTPPSLAL